MATEKEKALAAYEAWKKQKASGQTITEREKLNAEMSHPVATKSYRVRPKLIGESVKQGMSEFAGAVGTLGDIAGYMSPGSSMYLLKAKESGEPFPTGKKASEGWNYLLNRDESIVPENPSEEFVNTAGRFVGSGIPMTMKLGTEAYLNTMKNMPLKPSPFSKGINLISPKTAGYTAAERNKQALMDAAKIAGVDISSGITGGLGAEMTGSVAAESFGEDYRPYGEAMGGLGWGMVPYYLQNVAGGISNVWSIRKGNEAADAYMENFAKKTFRDAVGESPESLRNLTRAQQLQAEIEGFNPNWAAATNAKGLKALQSQVDSRSIAHMNASESKIADSKNAVMRYYDKQIPEMDDDLINTVRHRYYSDKGKIGAVVKKYDDQIAEIESRYQGRPNAVTGEKLEELYDKRFDEIRKMKSQKYKSLYEHADRQGITPVTKPIVNAVKSLEKSDPAAFQNMPNVYAKVKDIYEDGAQTSFRKFHSLWREINREYGKALKADDSAKVYYLQKLKDVADNQLWKMEDDIYGNFSLHLAAVNKWWKENYFDTFKTGMGKKLNKVFGPLERTKQEAIVQNMVLSRGTKGLDDFNKIYKGEPEAQELLREGIMDVLSSQIATSGLKSKTINNFLVKNDAVLKRIPDLYRKLSNDSELLDNLVRRRQKVIAGLKRYTDAANSDVSRMAGFPTINEAIDKGMSNPKILARLNSTAKTDEQKIALARGIADYVMKKNDPWEYILNNEEKLKTYLDRLGPNHFDNVKRVAEAMNILDRYKVPPTIAQMSNDPMMRKYGTSTISAFAQFRWAFFYGKTSKIYPFVDIGSKYAFKLGQEGIEKLIERSMYDPDLAKTLAYLHTADKKVPFKIWEKIGERAIANGIRVGTVAGTDYSEEQRAANE